VEEMMSHVKKVKESTLEMLTRYEDQYHFIGSTLEVKLSKGKSLISKSEFHELIKELGINVDLFYIDNLFVILVSKSKHSDTDQIQRHHILQYFKDL
jgi:hypothetical protein